MVPKFLSDRPYVDGIQLTFILLFPDFEENDIQVETTELPVRKPDDDEVYSFMMNIPVTATSYMLFWKAEATEMGMAYDDEVAKSMVLQQVGKIG